MDDYGKIISKMDNIIENFYEIGTLAESTSFFPVMQFVNLQSDLEDFYHALRGASEKAADFNYKKAKANLNSIYGVMVYADTDSVRVNSDDGADEDDSKSPTVYWDCFTKRIQNRTPGEHCKKCPYAWKCFKFQSN